MEQKKKLLIVDGNSVLNRAFYGVKPLTTREGLFTNAVYGMITIVMKQLELLAPDHAAIAFDLPAPTFRHKAYDGYKSTRKPMPEELRMQLPYAKEAMSALGFALAELPGFEADDLLGTLSARFASYGQAYILTGDRDSLQLIDDTTTVLLAGNRDTVLYDAPAFTAAYGVRPDQFVDVKAIMGDPSDHIPGVPGIGEKGAAALITAFGSLDGVYEHIDDPQIKAGMREKLRAGAESAKLSRFLAKIDRNAPLELSIEACRYDGVDISRFRSLCEKLEFYRFLEKYCVEPRAGDSTAPDAGEVAAAPAAVYEPLTLSQLLALPLPLRLGAELTVEGTEAKLALSDGTVRYLLCGTVAEFSPFLSDERRNLAVYDSKSFHKAVYTATEGACLATACKFDVMLGGYLLHAGERSPSLPELAAGFLHTAPDPADAAETVRRLAEALESELAAAGMQKLYREAELPLAAVLAKMECVGFAVDRAGLAAFSKRLEELAKEHLERIYFLSGEVFNVNSPKQLGEVLFEHMMLPAPKKNKTGYPTGAEVLEKLRPIHPVIDAILDYRQVAKLRSTYTEGLLRVADEQGRVHSTFHQTGTATGRLSSSDPNLQNIPIRTELGRELRRYFVPASGNVLVDADYSQVELRLLAAISGDTEMAKAFAEGRDIHTLTASQVFGVPPESVTFEMRKRAKAVNFGIVYGIGEHSLAKDLGIPRFRAKQYIDSYFATYPAVKAYMEGAKEAAKRDGFVTTLCGRRRYIPEIRSTKAQLRQFGERVAMNSPLQGTAADLMKLAMIRVDQALTQSGLSARLILQVHDELIVEASAEDAEAAAKILRREMEGALELPVPMQAEATVGATLYESK